MGTLWWEGYLRVAGVGVFRLYRKNYAIQSLYFIKLWKKRRRKQKLADPIKAFTGLKTLTTQKEKKKGKVFTHLLCSQ